MIADALWLAVELAALFVGVAFAVQLFQRRVGPARLRAWIGGPPVLSAIKGIAIGFLTPFCTYSAIPMLVGLRRAGVPPAGYVAFITAAPILDPVLFGALVLIVGVDAALLYSVVAFAGALLLALTAQRLGIERHLVSLGVGSPGTPPADECSGHAADSCGIVGHEPWRGFAVEAGPAGRSALELLRSVAGYLILGIAVGIGIEALVPPDVVARLAGGDGLAAIPVAAALGTPLYLHTSLFIPIAESLTVAGVGVGAIVALTIAGAGANLPEFIILRRLASTWIIAAFFGFVFGIALVGGVAAQLLPFRG